MTPSFANCQTRVQVQDYFCYVFSFARLWCRPIKRQLARDGVRTCGRWHCAFPAVLVTDTA
jgi:hypothetical protein